MIRGLRRVLMNIEIRQRWWIRSTVVFFMAVMLAAAARAQEPAGEKAAATEGAEALAKKLSNPIADLVSIPFQFNWQEGYGPNDDLQFVLNVQPVIPFHITKDLNMITRFIVPYVSQPELAPGVGPVSGFSTITFSTFFSPVSSSKFTWGVGPVIGLPMTSDPLLGGGQWLIGPTAVGLYQTGGWTMGALVNQQFSFADTGNTELPYTSVAFMQPFLAYTTKSAVTFTLQSQSTYNWEAASDQRWTVPINFLVSKLTKLGPFPFSIQGGGGYYAAHPDAGPKWRMQLAFIVLLPVAK
jgi:hypothetical protein